jgi:peptidoglycan/xylan/chitin deacetylase (PgdA/CDA1 family)
LLVLGAIAAAVFVARSLDAAPAAREPEPSRIAQVRRTPEPPDAEQAHATQQPGVGEPAAASQAPGAEATRAAGATRAVVAQARATLSRTAPPAAAAPTRATAPPAASTAAATRSGTPPATSTPAATSNTATSASGTPTGGTASGAAASAPAGGPRVALTFDAGADRGYAEDILDLLADQHVPASFGITGQWARANPDLVRRMATDGHLVINHTLDHRSFTGLSDSRGGLSPAARRAELEDADTIIAPLIGHSTRPWYRLPYGDADGHVASDLGSAGYTRQVGWTVDSLGWRGLSGPEILARCLKMAAPRAIYVLHVGRASHDGQALPALVQGLRERGYDFARVDAL